MANGKIRFGKQSGGELALVIPDGVSNTEVIVPESGVLATKDYADLKQSKSQLAYNEDTSSYIPNTLASGAIIERGSNTNGEYVKFADGTLICFKYDIITGNINVPVGAMFKCNPISISFLLAATFKEGTFPIFLGNARSGAGTFSVGAQVAASNNIDVSVLSATSYGYGSILDIALIGRWK